MKLERATIWYAASLALIISAAGCSAPVEEAEFDPSQVKLEGEADPALVGTWKSKTGATYVFDIDGTYSLRSDVKTQQGAFEVKVDAKWRKKGTRILLEDASKLVVPYEYQLKGNKLTLVSTGATKITTDLTKQ